MSLIKKNILNMNIFNINIMSSLLLVLLMFITSACSLITGTISTVSPITYENLEKKNMEVGNPVFIRIFKQENQLELWIKDNKGDFRHFKNYPICAWSGKLGPKIFEGDRQTPEGFYRISQKQLKPDSQHFLAFNIGYPNSYDQMFNRTGSNIMVHGGCSSSGCFAMTDANINEIYTIASAALKRGQKDFAVHIFPFRMTSQKTRFYKAHRWGDFWTNLKQGYDYFEKYNIVPLVEVNYRKESYDFTIVKG